MARTKTKLTQSEKVTSTNATVFFEDNSLPSSKLKDFKADGNVTWSNDLHIPSAKAIFTWAGSLFVKLANKVTAWNATPSNDNVPSEKLVKDSLDLKANIAGGNSISGNQNFDSSTLFVDSVNHRVGVGTDTPAKLRNKLNVSGNISFDPVADPTNLETSGMTLNINGSGNVPIGTYYYAVVFSTIEGDTKACRYEYFPSIVISSPSSVLIQNIPISSDSRVLKRKIYRSQAGTVGDIYSLYYIGSINDNTTTSYLDNSAKDVTPRDWVYDKNNTTSGILYRGTQKMLQVTDYITGVGNNVFASIVSGTTCAAFGSGALQAVTTGSSNHAFGHLAGQQITTGSENVCMGYAALAFNIGGSNNVAIGHNSLRAGTGTSYQRNSALGDTSLYGLTGGNSSNVGVGYRAGRNSQGSNNIFIGANSGNRTVGATVGNSNVIIGHAAAQNVFSHYNVLLGASTETLNTTDQNSIAIGYGCIGHGSNTVTLGHTTINKTVLRGDIETNSAKYQYIAASTTADTVNDIRVSNSTGSLKIEKCTAANATKGNGTWIDIPIGDVVGPSGATDNAIPRFDGYTGKLIQNSAVFIDDNDRVHFSEKAVNGMLVWPAIDDVSDDGSRDTRNMFMNSGDLLVNAEERGMNIFANRPPDNGELRNVFKNTGAGVKPYWSNVSPANPVIITIDNIPNVSAYKMLLVPGGRNSMPVDYSLELWSVDPSYGVNGYDKLVDVSGDPPTTYLKILDTKNWEGIYKIVLTVTRSGDADRSGYFDLDNLILYERYVGDGRFTGYNMSACGDTVYGDYRFHGKVGINTVPVTPLDVNGTSIFREHVNIRNTKYIYLCPSPFSDTVNDIRISNNNGLYKIEKCTVANATKHNGTWTNIPIGDVVGPSGATADGIALFNSTGKSIKDSGKKLSDYQTVVSKVAISSGNTYVIADNTEYRAAAAITTITFTAPASGNYECYVRFTTASTGTISVSFPNGIIGNPIIGNSETWEFSCKDGYTLAIQLS